MPDIGIYFYHGSVRIAADDDLCQKSKRLTWVYIYTFDQYVLQLIMTYIRTSNV